MYPFSDTEADIEAAHREDGFRNRWFLDAVLGRGYPEDMLERYAEILPPIADGDLETIAAPLDFLGINYYTRNVVRAGVGEVATEGAEHTDMGWEVYPDGLRDLLVRLHAEYELPDLYITENGAAFPDSRNNGTVRDPRRIAYLGGHLDAVASAIADGVPVRGYFLWSLLDNFEWAFGYSRRFGIVYVDYRTLERTPKSSALWYSELIAAHRERARSAGLALDA
jgi:beta-glucosidase